MTEIEKIFHKDMLNIYKRANEELGYRASRFLQMISEKGAIATAISLASKPGGTDGFTVLWENKRLDLSVEALILKSEYRPLFGEELCNQCKERLLEYGYNPD